jgi:trehalose/maltose transport system permease protein
MASKRTGLSVLAKREERLAWEMHLPTFVVIVLIAFYPLGSVFYSSFTNRTFASSVPTETVGVQNYRELLSMTIKQLEPVTDPETGEQMVNPRTGQPVYQPAVQVLPREPMRYREVVQFSLFGKQFVLGATDPDFILSVRDTLVFTLATVALELVLGLGIALVINGFPAGSIARAGLMAVMLIPWAIPTAVSSRMWQFMFGSTRTGFFNTVLWYLGLGDGNIPFLTDPRFQLPAMITIDVWKTTSFMALLLLAGLQLIPGDLYEAASVDGASKWKQFWGMTLPLLRPTIAVALVFRTLDALRVFDVFQIVLAQSRFSMASFTYYELINNRAMGYASASSVIIFVLILIFAMLYIRMVGVRTE